MSEATLYRQHRGWLADSMETVQPVESVDDIRKIAVLGSKLKSQCCQWLKLQQLSLTNIR